MKWSWLCLLAIGCAGPLGSLRVTTPLELGAQRFILRSDDKQALDALQIQAAITRATPGLQRWGGLVEPVTVYIVKSHDDLEAAVHRAGFAWLRAWGRYDEVIFQAPSTWTSKQEIVDQLVLHELTHCLLFQRSGTRETWFLKSIPLWFREGMAISTAGQASLYPSLEDSARWLSRNPTLDAFRDGEALSEGQSSEIYGLALHAFEFLERRYGPRRIEELIATMRKGGTFDAAFLEVIGLEAAHFQKDFENYLRLRAFRGSRQRFNAPPVEAPSPRPGKE